MNSRTDMFIKAREAFLSFDQGQNVGHADLLCDGVKMYKQAFDGGDFIVFGVNAKDQDTLDFAILRTKIDKQLGFEHSQDYFQVIGDSALYAKESTAYAQKFIQHAIEGSQGIILYGYTGSRNKDASALPQRDINQLVSDWVDEESEFGERSCRVIANIVDEHTNTAIDTWGCSISANVRYFFMVYTDTAVPSAKFGDDIKLSDGLTNQTAFCLDGGIQSFRQICYMLSRDINISGVSGLRDLSDVNNIRYFDQETKKPYLSAIEFIAHMKVRIHQHVGAIDDAVLETLASEYLETHALYNKAKKDAMTKDALWQAGWQDFKAVAWRKLDLFSATTAAFKPETVSAAALVNWHRQRSQDLLAAEVGQEPGLKSNANSF